MRWISVNERLPEEGGAIWCSFLSRRGVEVVKGYYSRGIFYNVETGAEIPTKYWKGYYTPKPPKYLIVSPFLK